MWSYKITFKSLNDTLSFLVKSENEDLVNDFVYGLFEIFGDIQTRKIESLQKNDLKTQSKIREFISEFEGRFPPSIKQISSYFNKLGNDEFFLFLPNIELTIQDSNRFYNYLLSLKGEKSFQELNEEFEATIGKTLNSYDLKVFGGIRSFIGNKTNRKCRFCGKIENETTFKNKSHAISEGLGNKKVFLYDECDNCNDWFSIEIEPDLINYLSIFRTFYNVKGKGGNKKIKGKNFKMSKSESVEIKFQGIENRPEMEKNPNEYNLNLELHDKVNSQDIYRCLVKFCLSVIDESELCKFNNTIEWVNKKLQIEKLPKIGELISYQHFTTEPKLFLYIRKNDNTKIPYMVGEFHFTCIISTFIIPLCNEDKYDFVDIANYNDFWNEFYHFTNVKGWSFNDFSLDEDRALTYNLNMSKNADDK